MELAPIVLFVYNRPVHARLVLKSLSADRLANSSRLYIYSDGPKADAKDELRSNIEEVRKLIKEKLWCKEVIINESPVNKGLAQSVIHGINEVLESHDSIIVLEDDTLPHDGFLEFMNAALIKYKSNEMVGGISGWSFPISENGEAYFSRVGSCWGWATWKRVWKELDWNGANLLAEISMSERKSEFNVDDSYDYFQLLQRHLSGSVDSWAIRFYANYFLSNKLFLFPGSSLIENIGFDGSGTHYNQAGVVNKKYNRTESFEMPDFPVRVGEKPAVRKKIRNYFLSESKVDNKMISDLNFLRKLWRLIQNRIIK